jgi:predicted DNA-binding mobile mystery protein A
MPTRDPGKERRLRQRVLDRRLAAVRATEPVMYPTRKGWITALRSALGMSQQELGRRLGVSRQAVSQLEEREANGSITLNALRQAAAALGAHVVYAFVTDRPVMETLEARAQAVARHIVTGVHPSKRLADPETEEARIAEVVEELLAAPRRLWSYPDELPGG